jgi:hypothetical protein
MGGLCELHAASGDGLAPVNAVAVLEGFLDEALLQIGKRAALAWLLLDGSEQAAIEFRVLRFDDGSEFAPIRFAAPKTDGYQEGSERPEQGNARQSQSGAPAAFPLEGPDERPKKRHPRPTGRKPAPKNQPPLTRDYLFQPGLELWMHEDR